jgi:hypothetical protein
MYLVSALESTFCTSQVWFRCDPRQQILPRFCLRSQLLTRL